MPKFLVMASYTQEGAKGVIAKGGSARRDAVRSMAEGLGGRVESFYFAFGKTDVYVIVDAPDAATAVAISLAVNAAGGATTRTVPLLTPEDVDAAAKISVSYRAPGA